ncbi:MAG: flagellar biosynthetic protein FliO [Acidobacteria bacterium]|nr:flagellar biosynthetic protein FliO [Acidobacteriota bacterium]
MQSMAAVVVVLGFLIGLLWIVRRPAFGRGASGQYLLVLDTATITPGQSLALVKVAGRCLLVGAGNGHMEKLAEFPAADLPAPDGRKSSRLESGHLAIWLSRLRPRDTPPARSTP